MQNGNNLTAKIEALLALLNEWTFGDGVAPLSDPLMKSTGESNARVAQIKQQLSALGAHVRLQGDRYVLDEAPGDDSGKSDRPNPTGDGRT